MSNCIFWMDVSIMVIVVLEKACSDWFSIQTISKLWKKKKMTICRDFSFYPAAFRQLLKLSSQYHQYVSQFSQCSTNLFKLYNWILNCAKAFFLSFEYVQLKFISYKCFYFIKYLIYSNCSIISNVIC